MCSYMIAMSISVDLKVIQQIFLALQGPKVCVIKSSTTSIFMVDRPIDACTYIYEGVLIETVLPHCRGSVDVNDVAGTV